MPRSTKPRLPRRRAAETPRPAVPRAPRRWWLLATTALLPVTGTALAQAPTGGQVVAGQAAIAQGGNRTTITQRTDRAAIDWQQFNVGSGHTVQFVQPNQGSWTLNRVVGPDPSVIAGRIQANGGVAIVNQSGMVFAGGAQVDVGSLIASAANISNRNFMAGRMVFDGQPRRGARVENHGTITVADRGLAALVGPGVSNSGVIRANLGRVALGAAETFVLDLAGDGLIGIDVTSAVTAAPDGGAALVTNSGVIEAAGGSVLLSAHAASGLVEDLVRNTGRIETPTRGGRTGEIALRADGGGVRLDGTLDASGGAGERGGQVALQATGQVTVGAAARVDASGGAGGGRVRVGTAGRGRNQAMAARTTIERGATIRADATANGTGGEILVNSTERTEMRGTLSARGGATGGDGGFIEVSGQSLFVLDGIVDLRAPEGALGTFLLDPRNIFIADSGTALDVPGNTVGETPADLTTVAGSVTGPGAVSATSGATTDWVRITPDVIETYAAGNITLDATRQIVIADPVTRDAAGDVTLRAGLGGPVGTGNITQRAGADISVNGVLTMQTGTGAINLGADLRATGVVLAAAGNITQTGGTIAHRTAGTELPLTVNASGGSVSLARPGNGIFALGASSAGADFALSGAAIRLTGPLAGDTVSLAATTGALALDADIRATDLTLTAATGIAQGAGATIAHRDDPTTALPVSASVTGTGDIVLDQANGSLEMRDGGTTAGLLRVASAQRLAIAAGQTVSVGGAAAFTVTGAGHALVLGGSLLAESVTLAAEGDITQTGGRIGHVTAGAELPLSVIATGGTAAVELTGATNGRIALTASSAAGDFALTGETIRVTGDLAGNAVGLTATAGAIVLDADLRATSVSLRAVSGIAQGAGATMIHRVADNFGLPLAVSLSGAGDIVLDQANGNLQLLDGGTAAGLLRIGSNQQIELITGQTLSVAGATTLAVTGNGQPLILNGSLFTDSLTLSAQGAITQGADGVLARLAAGGGADLAAELPVTATVTGNGHALALQGDNGALRVLGATTEDGSITITARRLTLAGAATAEANGAARSDMVLTATLGMLALDATMTARNAAINAGGAVTQTAAIDLGGTGGGRLILRGAAGGTSFAGGTVALTLANLVTELDARAAGALRFTAAGDLAVAQARGAGVTLTGGALTVAAGAANASGIVASGTGDVAIIADSLTAPGRIATANGRTIALRVDGLDLGGANVSAGAAGRVEIGPRSSDFAVQIGTGGNPAGTLELATADLAAITTGTLQLGRTTIAGEATATVTAQGVSVVEAVAPSAALSLVSADGITVGADITAPSVRMETTVGDIALGAVAVQADGPAAAITLLAAGGITRDAGGRLVAPDGTVVNLVAHAALGIDLAASGDFRLAGGIAPAGVGAERALFAGLDISFSTTGTITVAAPVESQGAVATVSLAGGAIAIEAPILTAPLSSLSLTASGNGAASTITQTGAGLIRTGTLSLAADGAIDLSHAPNEVATLGAVTFTNGFGYRSTTGFTVGAALGPTDAGDADISITADTGDILLQAAIGAGTGTVRLDATTGDIVQDAAGAAITAGRLELNAGGDALLDPTLAADRNVVGVLGTSTVGGVLAFNAAGDLALDGAIGQSLPGGALRIQSGGTLALNAGAVLGFDGIMLSAPGQMTLRGTIGLDQATPASAVRLGAGAGITQEAGGRIVADGLGIRAVGDVLLADGTNAVRQIAAAAGGVFALDTAGALATASITDVPLPGAAAATIVGVLGQSVTLSADYLTINPGGLGGGIGAGVHASAADGTVTLRADALTLNALVAAGEPAGSPTFGGTVTLAPRTLGRAVVLGGAEAGTLSISNAMLQALVARHIVIGRAEAAAGALTVAGAVTPLNGVNSVLLQGGGIVLDDVFTLSTAGGLLTLSATSGDITQGAGAVVAPRLQAEAQAGSVRLDGTVALNQVGQVAGGAATGETFAFRGAGSFTVAAPGISAPGGTVTLSAPGGGITQSLGAPIVTTRLTADAAGAVVLDGGGAAAGAADLNRVATLGASVGSSLTLRNRDALTVEGVTANGFAGSAVVLEAPDLTLAGTIAASTADGRVVLRTGADFDTPAAGGTVVQTAGIIRTRDLSVSAGDSIDLRQANEIGRLAAGSGAAAASTDSIVLRDGGTVNLTDAAGGIEIAARVSAGAGSTVEVIADGLTVAPGLAGTVFSAPGGVVRFLPFTAGATIGLGGSGDAIQYATSLLRRVQTGRLVVGGDRAGTITLREALDLSGAGAPVTFELRSDGDILAGGFDLSVPRISAVATGAVTLGTAGSAIGRIVASEVVAEGIAGAGAISVTTGGVLAVDAAIRSTGGAIALQAADFAIGAEGAVVAPAAGSIRVRSTAGAGLGLGVAEGQAGLSQTEIARLRTNGGTLRFEASAITLAGDVTGGDAALLDLAATGAVTQTGGSLAALALRVDGASVQIDRAGNALPRIEATATGDIAIGTGGATTLRGTRSTNGNVAITAAGITLSDAAGSIAVRAAGTATLTATLGDITGATGLAAVQATRLAATAAGAITLTGDNAVGTLAAIAGTGVTFRNTIALTAGATGAGGGAVAGDVTLAAPSLVLDEVLATGTVDLTASAGAIAQAAGARLAAATLRAGAPGAIILDGTNPDGTARNQVQDIDALSGGGDITLRNALALTLDLPLSVGAGQVLTLEAPTLTLGDDLAAGAGGRIILRTGAFEGGIASGGDIVQAGGTISTPLLAALAGGQVAIDRAGNAIGALGGGRSAAGVDLGLGLVAGTSGVLRSDGFGGDATLGVSGAIGIGSGGTLILRADDLAIGAAIRVPDGRIILLPVTTDAGIGYVLGGASGSTTAGRITLDSTELAFLPTGTPAAELILGALGETGSIDIAGTVGLATDGGAPRVARLSLLGDGALTQGAGTAIDVAALSAIFPNGAVLLDPGGAGNRIAALEGVIAGGAVTIRGGAGMMELRDGGAGAAIVAGAGSDITLRADDIDVQATVQAPGGTIAILPETAGRAVTLGGDGAGTLALDSAEIARLGGGGTTLDAPGALRLRIGGNTAGLVTAGDIRITGDVSLRGPDGERVALLDLQAGSAGLSGGSVSQSGGTVDVAALTGQAQGDFRVDGTNSIDSFGLISAGQQRGGPPAPAPVAADVALRTTGDALVGALSATRNLTVEAGGSLTTGTVTLPGGLGAGSGIAAGEQVRLSAGGALSAGGVVGRDIALEGGSVVLTGLIGGSGASARSVAIDTTGALTQQAGALLSTNLLTIGAGTIALPEDNRILELNGVVATGAVLSLNTVLPLLVSGAVSANGSLTFTTDQSLTVADTGSITVTGGPGTATLLAGGAIDFAGVLTTIGAATLTAGDALSFTGTAGVDGAFTLGAGAGITLGGGITVGGDILATAIGALSSTATLAATNGIALAAGTELDLGGRWTAGAAARFTAGDAFTYTATGLGGGAVTLETPGAIIAASGSTIRGDGVVRLEAGTTLDARGAIAGGALVDLRATTGAMVLAGGIDAAGAIAAQAGQTLTTTAAMSAGGAIGLSADEALTVSGSLTAGGTLTLAAGAGMALGGRWSANGAARFTAGGLLAYTGTGAGSADVSLVTPGGITASAGSTIRGAGQVLLDAGTDLAASGVIAGGPLVELRARGGAMALAGSIDAATDFTAAAGTTLRTTATILAGRDARLAADAALAAGASITAGRDLTLGGATGLQAGGTFSAGRDATLAANAGAVAIAGRLSAGGGIGVSAGTRLDSSAQIQAGGALAAAAGTDMTLGGLHRAGTTLDLAAGAGLDASGTLAGGATASLRAGQSMALQGTVQAGDGLTIQAGGTLAFAATGSAGGRADVSAGGDLAQSGTLTAAAVLLSAGGALTQSGAVSASGELRLTGGSIGSTGTLAAAGPISLAAGGALAQAGFLQSSQGVGITAGGSLSLTGQAVAGADFAASAGGAATLTNGKITAGTTVRLSVGQGISLQSFQIDPTTIAIETPGALSVVSSTLVSSESIRLAGGTVALRDNSITTGTLEVDAAGTLTLDGGRYVIGRAMAFTAPAGISSPSVIVVTPRDGVLPAVLYDTRAAGALPDALSVVQPDVAGRPANLQATQVRLPGTEAPGAFGAASSAAAGPMEINVDAGQSAIFLLLDGGTVTGTIVSAGRLGIHGTGGSAELTGSLLDPFGTLIDGPSAARFADSTRPASTGALTRYRINGCVVSSINCVVPSQVLTIPQAPPQRIDIRLWGGAITDPDVQLPNIAEEDY